MRSLFFRPMLGLLAVAIPLLAVVPGCSAPLFAQSYPGQAISGAPAQARIAASIHRVADHPDLAPRISLPGHRASWARSSADTGAVTPGLQLQHLALVLTRPPEIEAAFQQLLHDQQDPTSPRFHQWLTPQQTGALYGPSTHDLDAVTAWLAAQGLAVESVSPSRLFVTFSGDATSVAAAFATEIHTFATGNPGNSGVQYGLTRDPSIPQALAPVLQGVLGLNQEFVHTNSHQAPVTIPATGGVHPNITFILNGLTYHWIMPSDFATLYDVTPVYNSGITGTGQSVAIIGASHITPADISNFETLAGLATRQPNTLLTPGQADPGTTGDGTGGNGDGIQGEATLDVTRVLGTATSSPVDLVLVHSLAFTDLLAGVNYAVSTLNDPILSLSFGACEVRGNGTSANPGNKSQALLFDAAFSTAASQGISVFISSGDSEVAGCAAASSTYAQASNDGDLFQSTNLLCTPNVTCVGGTQFSDTSGTYWSSSNGTNYETAISYIPEGVWNEPGPSSGSYIFLGGGGGPSIFFAKPTWQIGTGVPADSARDTPDISLSASGHNAYLACTAYSGATCAPSGGSIPFTGFSGTSAAAPGMAGIAAMLNQRLNARQGNLAPLLYQVAASTYTGALHDATPATSGVTTCSLATASTCNSSTPGRNGLTGGVTGFALTSGYDLATGLGSLDVANFFTAAAALSTTTTPVLSPSTTTLVVTSSPASINQTITLTVSVASSAGGTPTGTIQFSAPSGVLAATSVALVSGKAQTTVTFPAAGTYTVTASYAGDTAYTASAASAPVTISPTTLPTPLLLLAGTSGTTDALQNVVYSATLSGSGSVAPTGSIRFYRGGTTLLGQVALTNGSAALAPFPLPVGTYTITAVYAGDANYTSATSNALTVTVTLVPVLVRLTSSSPSTINLNQQPITVTTTVVSSEGGTPTGTVQFAVDGVTQGAAAGLPATLAVSASIPLPVGTHTIAATYSGDSIFAPATASFTITVTQPAFTMQAAPASVILASGATTGNTSTVTVTSINGFSAAVALTCNVAYQGSAAVVNAPTCVLSPTSLTPAANGTATSTLSFSSTVPHSQPANPQSAAISPRDLLAFAALLLLLPLANSRRLRRTGILLVLAAALLTASGCGSGGSAPATLDTQVGSTSGSYLVTVTATSGSTTLTSNVIFAIQ